MGFQDEIMPVFSSIVNEGIRVVLNLFIFFFTKRFHRLKKHKKHKKHKNYKKHKNHKKHKKLKKHQKSTKRKQATFFTLDVFYAHKKHKNHETPNKRFSS